MRTFELARIFHPFRREALVTNIAELSPFVARHVRFTTVGVFLHIEDRGPKHNAATEGLGTP
jgi:hypothetical protein